jgi:hypothetical protein
MIISFIIYELFRSSAMPFTATFDTGALDDMLWPESAKQPTDPADATRVRAAVQAGVIQGFFSETLITLEGIKNIDRAAVLSSSQLVTSSSSESENSITINVAFQQDRLPLPPKFVKRIQAARDLRMRALMVPRSADGVCAKDDDGTLFKPPGDLEQFVAKAVHLRSEIGARDIGRAVAVKLGLKLSARDGVSEWWYYGLKRAKDIHECRQVERAVSEWADGDSIAAHYGYGIDLFCSKDFGKGASALSVLDCANRKWLSEEFGIRFVTLRELADMVAA